MILKQYIKFVLFKPGLTIENKVLKYVVRPGIIF
jgi:hypothetical protein